MSGVQALIRRPGGGWADPSAKFQVHILHICRIICINCIFYMLIALFLAYHAYYFCLLCIFLAYLFCILSIFLACCIYYLFCALSIFFSKKYFFHAFCVPWPGQRCLGPVSGNPIHHHRIRSSTPHPRISQGWTRDMTI